MKPNIKSTSEFIPNQFLHKFFLDSNVWFYLFFPQSSNVSKAIIEEYSKLYDLILQKECLIETSVLQISELVNLILRIDFNKYCKDNNKSMKFKEYSRSLDGQESLARAQILIDSIVKTSTIRSGNLNENEMKSVMKNINKADFNDMCIVKHCEKENSILITHDFDFNALDSSIQIISANQNYLKL